ncbi:hypothetical protein [Parageobacillus galactosidasius]|uniref:hypothetical protein n=1 Tax=Parageobacillus galactosidasius TaxID=883812 RepID=UPI00146CDBB2|nr:hypothetical protein [Parageobacillus galactosidasius]
MSVQAIIRNGEYLGYCEEKGYIYSVFYGYDERGRKIYRIYAIKGGEEQLLIEFTGVK